MAIQNNFCAVHMAILLVFVLFAAFVRVDAVADSAKTVTFDVKPGGVVHTFNERIGEYECSFTYAAQGGTNEQWSMSVGLSDDNKLFSCSVFRPQGKSYLFFTQFKAELKGAKITYANAFSEASITGPEVSLRQEEFSVGETVVTHTDGKFKSQLSKMIVIGRTKHDEL